MSIDLREGTPLEAPPSELTPEALTSLCLAAWQIVLRDDPKKALALLSSLPSRVRNLPEVSKAREETLRVISGKRLSILIWTGPAWATWSPRQADETGIGGSETAAVRMAEELAARGHDVTVASECGEHAGTYEDVRYVRQDLLWNTPDAVGTVDVAIVSRQAWALPRFKARLKVLWVHDVHFGEDSPQLRVMVDEAHVVFALTQWHSDFLQQTYPWLNSSKIAVTRNAVDGSRFTKEVPKEKCAVYASSLDRGLDRLLDLWPRVLSEVPDAELHVCYGFNTWEKMVEKGGAGREQIDQLKIKIAETKGVVYHGLIDQRTLADVYLKARVLAYPTWFHETSCISAREAMAAGCVPVTTRLAALAETVHHGVLLDPPCTEERYGELFVGHVVAALRNDGSSGVNFEQVAREARETELGSGGWAKVAEEWEHLFRTRLDRKEEEDEQPPSEVRVEVARRPLRIAITLGRLGASIHGVMNVDAMAEGTGPFSTGTPRGFFTMAHGLAELGHTVDAFADLDRTVVRSRLGGANFYRLDDASPDHTYDCYASVNEPDVLRSTPSDELRVVLMWLNDFSFCQPGWDDHVDLYLAPSRTLATRLGQYVDPGKISVVPLGLDLERFEVLPEKRPGSMVWCSSPDRGLHHVLDFFPEVRKNVPVARLDVFYRLDPWIENALTLPGRTPEEVETTRRARVISESLMASGRNGENGIWVHGPSPPAVVGEALKGAIVFAYPCDPVSFTEGFSLSTLEACAAGCVPIISDADALPEIYGSAAVVVAGRPGEKKAEWVYEVERAMLNVGHAAEVSSRVRSFARSFSRQAVAASLEREILKQIR